MVASDLRKAGPIKLPVLLNGATVEFVLEYFEMPQSSFYVLHKNGVARVEVPLLRIHSACNIAHIFYSQRCDCQPQLELAMQRIHNEGDGFIFYAVHQEGRGVGAFDHVRVYQKQDEGYDTHDSYVELGLPVDCREYSDIRYLLHYYQLDRVRLLTNNPRKIESLERLGIHVERQSLLADVTEHNQSQIRIKIEKLGHLIPATNAGV